MKVHIAYTHKDNGSGVWVDTNGKELTSDYCKGNEVFVTDKDGKEVQTKARFLQYTGKVLREASFCVLGTAGLTEKENRQSKQKIVISNIGIRES